MRRTLFRAAIASAAVYLPLALGAFIIFAAAPAWPGEAPKGGLLATAPIQNGPPQPLCAATRDIRDKLIKQYDETQRSIGLANGGQSVLEIYSSPKGSWTAVITTPNSVTCIVATGEYWMDVKQPVPGMGM